MKNFFFPTGMAWNFLLYYFNHSAQQIWSDGIHRKRGGEKKRTERKDTCSCGSWEETYLSLSLSPFPPLLFSLFPQRTLIRLDSSRFRSNDCTPRQWAAGLKFRFRPRRRFLFFSPLFSTTMACSTIDREKFSLVKLSHCPGLSLVSRGSATGLAVVIVSNYLKPRHPTGRNIFFPPPRVSPHCPPPPPTCFPLDVATREAFLPPPPRSQFTEELIPDAERRRGSTKGGG